MKQTTNDWFTAAEDDLLAAKTLKSDFRLTNLAAFHCQQCLEKSFKAVIEENEKPAIKSHDLFRLQFAANIQLSENEINLLAIQDFNGFGNEEYLKMGFHINVTKVAI